MAFEEKILQSHDGLGLYTRVYPGPAGDAASVLCLLDESGVTPAVIGTSLGGILAIMLAVTQRARIAGIVLNDIGPEIDPAGIARIKGYAGRTPPAADWEEAAAQTRAIYGAAWPDLPPDRWAVLTRRGCRDRSANADGGEPRSRSAAG